MIKRCFIAALLAAFLILPFSSYTAQAYSGDTEPDDATTIDLSVLQTPELDEEPPRPFTPPGTGTVIDHASDSDGKEFYTIITPNENVFYLIIDNQRNQQNVYFLNAVTEADLMALAVIPERPAPPIVYETPSEQDEPQPVPEPEQDSSSNSGIIIIVIAVVVIGGGAGWYFKVYRPKQLRVVDNDEYEPHLNESDEDYLKEWDDYQEETDENPPWDEDENDV